MRQFSSPDRNGFIHGRVATSRMTSRIHRRHPRGPPSRIRRWIRSTGISLANRRARPSISIYITMQSRRASPGFASTIPTATPHRGGTRRAALPSISSATPAYFVAGMNQQADVTVHGNVGWSVAENMMSGTVRVQGWASECRGASGHGGLLVIERDASSRCGISLKGLEIVVGGSVGHMSAFMAQAGTLVVCGDAAHGLGDSLYEAVIYVRGTIEGLGTDAREEPLGPGDIEKLRLCCSAGRAFSPRSAQFQACCLRPATLYHWHIDVLAALHH